MASIVRVAALIACSCLLLAAGCGGDEEDGAPAGTAGAPAGAPETGEAAGTEGGTTEGGAGQEPTEDDERAEPAACGDVAFEPNTDFGAFGVRATGTDCETAREVAGAAEDAGGVAYEAQGFTCDGAPRGGELPTIEWTCTGDGAEITFSTS